MRHNKAEFRTTRVWAPKDTFQVHIALLAILCVYRTKSALWVLHWLDTTQSAVGVEGSFSASFSYFFPINYKWPIYCHPLSKPHHMFLDWFPTFQAASQVCWVNCERRKCWNLEALLAAKTGPLYLIVFEILFILRRILYRPPQPLYFFAHFHLSLYLFIIFILLWLFLYLSGFDFDHSS